MILRDYQKAALYCAINSNAKKALIQMPTGSGKSLVIGAIANYFHNQQLRTLVISPRVELVKQNAAKINNPDIDCLTINKAYMRHDFIDVLIIDECHKVKPNDGMYQTVMGRAKKVIGLTATPYRMDCGSLIPSIFDELVYALDRSCLIDQGYLVKRRFHPIPPDYYLNVSEKALKNQNQLSQEVCPHTAAIMGHIKAVVDLSKRTLIFAIDLEHASEIAFRLSDPISYSILSCHTPHKTRARIIEGFLQGDINVLINCELLTTGFDCPPLANIVVLRPTESYTLYEQILGRGDRPYPDKEYCNIYDFTLNYFNFKSPTLKGTTVCSVKFCMQCGYENSIYHSKCKNCQASLVQVVLPERTCPECKEKTYPKASYCHLCHAFIRKNVKKLIVKKVEIGVDRCTFNGVSFHMGDVKVLGEDFIHSIAVIYYKIDFISGNPKIIKITF